MENMIKRYAAVLCMDESGPYVDIKEDDTGTWVKFEDHKRFHDESERQLLQAQNNLGVEIEKKNQLAADKRELVEMLEKYQSHNRIHNDTESELFYEAAALIAKHKEG